MSDPTRADAAAYRAAAPGSLVGLYLAVKGRVAAVAAGFPMFETKGTPSAPGDPRAPIVFDGWLPPKKSPVDQAGSTANEQYSFLLVRPRFGTDSPQGADQSAIATVEIVVGTYSDTDDGWIDVLLLVDAIRLDLGAAPAIQGTGFEQTGPLEWELELNQPRPQWLGHLVTNWTLPRPRRVEALNPTED